MELSKVTKGQEVLVIDSNGVHCVGDMLTVKFCQEPDRCALVYPEKGLGIYRFRVLAVGDKVVRGPDSAWNHAYHTLPSNPQEGDVGKVGGFDKTDQSIRVEWESGGESWCKPKEIKPVGDSEEVGEDKPECYRDTNCAVGYSREQCSYGRECWEAVRIYGDFKPKPIKEKVMTREQRAKDLEKTMEEAVDAKQTAIDTHEEDLAQRDESMSVLAEQIADMKLYKTDKAKKVATVVKAKNADGMTGPEEQAEAIIWCNDNEIAL